MEKQARPYLYLAPSNEQEVVLLFGLLLPYLKDVIVQVKEISDDYPDCLALDPNGREIHIEFEHRASNFRQHGHNLLKCDLIVCWQNDWPDSPVRILELRQVVKERAPWLIEHPERSRAHEGKWTEEEFMAQASRESAELLRSIKDVVARYPGVLGLRSGEGDKEPTFRVTLLNWKERCIYCIYAREPKVDVDFTAIQEFPSLEQEFRDYFSNIRPKALEQDWIGLPCATGEHRRAFVSALSWLAQTLKDRRFTVDPK